MTKKLSLLLQFTAFIALINLLVGVSLLLGADMAEKKLIMFENTVDPKGNTVSSTPIYAYCARCTCKDK